MKKGALETARAIYQFGLEKFPTKKSLWLNAVKLEQEYGDKST